MDIKKVTAIWFSPTGGTRAVTERVAAGLDAGFEGVDVTAGAMDMSFGPEEVVVLGVPVFGGRVPAPVAERLARLSAAGTPAVLLAVYGNRAYEDALLELRELASARGFHPFAAGAFIARHSIAPEYGRGRPDAKDKQAMEAFAAALGRKLKDSREASELPTVIVPGNRDYRKFDGLPLKPAASKAKCGKCGKCAKECPVGAIPADDPTKTDGKKCISCMRCISVCPHYARSLNPALLLAAKSKLKKACAERREPETFM